MFKTTKAKVIFVIIFSFICILATAFLIIYKNIDISETSNKSAQEETDPDKVKDVPGIDLKGTYNQNDLRIEQKIIEKQKVHIEYSQISGLKNKEIQDKINKELQETALNCYQEKIKDLNEVVNVNVSMWNSANFGNTISFNLYYYAKINDDSDDLYQQNIGINYDLNTGEKIELNKLFTSDAPIENILRKSTYYAFVENRAEINLNGDFVVDDYGEIEEEVAEIIIKYKNGELKEFYYTPTNIQIYYNDIQCISVEMEENADYIAIYNRYLAGNELYENNNIGLKNLYTVSTRYTEYYYYINYQNEKNYFIDINIMGYSEDEFTKKLLDEKIKEIEAEIAKVKTLASQNSNNFYLLNYSINAYTGKDWQTKQEQTSYYEFGNSYEMTVHDFEENIELIIVEYNRNALGGGGLPDYVYNLGELLKIEPQQTIEYYNPETGEKIVI